ncbi:MAG TPA: serine hydrolase domain-containing protein [Thermoanaerobaculia bacterium]|nr:serine hydrolase domain-containing protein [Thermoanaerobaculia bacterium]
MHRFTVVALLLSACASAPGRDYARAIEASTATMRALVEKDRIPGAAIAVTKGDRIVWHDTFGVTDLAAPVGVRAETRFRVGSVTKMLTAAALLRLADQHRLRLDDPVRTTLPDFPHGEITLRQLAGHLGGIRHYSGSEFLNHEHFLNARSSLRRFANDPLLSSPGAKYAYSTYGYNVLGAVIEEVTGKDFENAMRELVTGPLKMTETTFADDAVTTTLYDNSKEGPVVAPAVDLSDRLPAGAAVTTARDLARFLAAMSGDRFLSAASRAAMVTPQQTLDGKPITVGIGWRVATDGKGRTFLHHGGAVTGGRAMVLFYPQERVGVAILTNLGFATFNEKQAGAIAEAFLDSDQ